MSLFLRARCPQTKLENHLKPAYEDQMGWMPPGTPSRYVWECYYVCRKMFLLKGTGGDRCGVLRTAQDQQSLLTWTHCSLGFIGIQPVDHHNRDCVTIQTWYILLAANGEQIMDVEGQVHIMTSSHGIDTLVDAIISPHMHDDMLVN